MWVEFVVGSLPSPGGYSTVTPIFQSPQEPKLPNNTSIWNARSQLSNFLRTPKCFAGKHSHYIYSFTIYSWR